MKHSKSFVTCLCQLFDALRQLSLVHHHTGIEKFVVRAYREIETVKAAVASARSDVDALHLRVYEQTLEKSQTINVAESAPRVASRQQHRQNIPASNISDYLLQMHTYHSSFGPPQL